MAHFLLHCDAYALPRQQLFWDVREWCPIGQLPTLPFLLGSNSDAPVAARRVIFDCVVRFVRATGRQLLLVE